MPSLARIQELDLKRVERGRENCDKLGDKSTIGILDPTRVNQVSHTISSDGSVKLLPSTSKQNAERILIAAATQWVGIDTCAFCISNKCSSWLRCIEYRPVIDSQ
jgi:hypothetical protein